MCHKMICEGWVPGSVGGRGLEITLIDFTDLMQLNGAAVTFLSTDALRKLPEKQKYSNFFKAIYFSSRFFSLTIFFKKTIQNKTDCSIH